jgi:hypothetical protein
VAQVGMDVAGAFFKFDHFRSPFACLSAAFNRSRIKSRSGPGVAMPRVLFFWKQ